MGLKASKGMRSGPGEELPEASMVLLMFSSEGSQESMVSGVNFLGNLSSQSLSLSGGGWEVFSKVLDQCLLMVSMT